ncbi:MAG: hypothetical protein AAGD43_04115 [Pseudomonadota bacterium]
MQRFPGSTLSRHCKSILSAADQDPISITHRGRRAFVVLPWRMVEPLRVPRLQHFSVSDLDGHTGAVLAAARKSPVQLTRDGIPRYASVSWNFYSVRRREMEEAKLLDTDKAGLGASQVRTTFTISDLRFDHSEVFRAAERTPVSITRIGVKVFYLVPVSVFETWGTIPAQTITSSNLCRRPAQAARRVRSTPLLVTYRRKPCFVMVLPESYEHYKTRSTGSRSGHGR